MKIIVFTHPVFSASQSMPRYANMLVQGMKERGYEVEVWTSKARFWNISSKVSIKKWLGYIDQYIVFPLEVRLKLLNCEKETLFVFSDQALGPWVPLACKMHHVVHCHDFLALNSSLGNVPENTISLSGKLYQSFIRKGFSKGKNFISISKKTEQDLHQLHLGSINSSVVCYNGLNRTFNLIDIHGARKILGHFLNLDLSQGYILHVGGNQYYKNRKGVIEIYEAWRNHSNCVLPLIMIGADASEKLKKTYADSNYSKEIYLISGLKDDYINPAYSGATCLLFPSLDEGFGWPIAEALASGTLVITTNRAPMTEVLGTANFFQIDRRPFQESLVERWANESSIEITKIVNLSSDERQELINIGLESIKRFDTQLFLDEIEKHYLTILQNK